MELVVSSREYGGQIIFLRARSPYITTGRSPKTTAAASKEDVEAMLSDAGCAVSSMRYHTDAETGQFRGFVHAELADESSLSNALALAGTRWRGRELRVSHSETGKKR